MFINCAAQHRSSPKRLQVNIHLTLSTLLLATLVGLFSSSGSAVKKYCIKHALWLYSF
jgi:hypothetical protein